MGFFGEVKDAVKNGYAEGLEENKGAHQPGHKNSSGTVKKWH